MLGRHFVIAASAMLWATGVSAQTHGQWLEKAIFAEETAGDLSAAIRIYEQLASATTVPPEIADRAQRRLSEVRRRRELSAGATAMAAQQPRTPTGLPGRIDPPPAAPAPTQTVAEQCCGLFSGNYDPARAVTVSGTVSAVHWLNPQAMLVLEGGDGNRWGFALAPPNQMMRMGMNKDSLKPGDQIVVHGYLATGKEESCPRDMPTACATLSNGALHAAAVTVTRVDGTMIFDRDPRFREAKAAELTALLRAAGVESGFDPSSVPGPRRGASPGTEPAPLSAFYDPMRQVSVTGHVTEVQWTDPHVVIFITDADGNRWGFALGSPDRMVRIGIGRSALTVGEELRIRGYLAKGQEAGCPGPLPNGCATLPNGARHASAYVIWRMNGSLLSDVAGAQSDVERRNQERAAQAR